MQSRIWFLLPGMLGVLIFMLLPFADVVRRSFQTAVTGQFCGFANYRMIFCNQAFLLAVKNTLHFVGVSLPLLIFISLLLAMAVNKSRYCGFIKSAFLFPLAVPTAALVLIWKLLFYQNGLLNTLLQDLGFAAADWLGSDMAFWVLVFSYLWKNLGYTLVLWLAAFQNIPESLMEAAKVDGATAGKCFLYVVLPGLKPMFYTITILSFLNSFKVFREAYLVAGSYPQEKIYLLQHLFQNWFANLEIDKMAAAAVCIAAVLAVSVFGLKKIWEA